MSTPSRSSPVPSEQLVHFHGGPWSGERRVAPVRSVFVVVLDAESLDLPAGQGAYFRDETSAGGRCYDWRASN